MSLSLSRSLRLFPVLLLATVGSFGSASAQTPGRPKITGIAFMRVYTSDPAAANKFYGTTLGLRPFDSGGQAAFAVNGSQWIEVRHSGAPPSPTLRLLSVGFTTTDVKALKQYLTQHGVQTEATTAPGQLAVRDPEGNLVTFVQASRGPQARAGAPLPSATSDRMIHVGFIVKDRAKEDAFWRDILGFRPYWHGGAKPDTTDWVSLQVPEGTDWLEYMLNGSPTPDLHSAGVSNHFSLGTDRMQTVMAGLERNGCEDKSCRAIQVGRDGKIQLNVYDPDQTRVEYMEFRPVLKPCCSEFTGPQPAERDAVK